MNLFQALEQTQAFLRDFSPLVCYYHQELVKKGMTREEALKVVIAWQSDVLRNK